jgi:predicted CXXCH cytochrome family protein
MQATRLFGLTSVIAFAVVVGACRGDTGPQGPEGPEGPPGEPGQPPTGEIEPEIFGLVGRIFEPNGTIVPSGTIYLVPASDVEALSATPIDLFASPDETAALDNDEPIEDLIDDNGGSYEQATVEENGEYRFETLPEGSHFVVWFPASDDAKHLPGGNNAGVSFSTASLIGMQMNIRVSAQPSAQATYVGSSTCMVCHGLESTTRTAHNVGLQVPGVRSNLQDIEPWPNFDDGLAEFDASTNLFFYDCDPGATNPSKCKVDDQSPGAGVSFELRLRRDNSVPLGVIGAYYVDMVEGVNTERYDIVLTYGGALGKQQYLTRRENADGSLSYFVLPVQYNYEGNTSNDSPEDWPWRDYRSELWFDFGGAALTQPDNAESFDNNCAGCHMTGYRLEGSDVAGWAAHAVVDSDGAFDYDGDGRVELINTGCESCHGPGSEHLELSPRGSYIVSPGSLTPGRQAALCGSCHSRPLGIGAGETGLPLSEANQMPPAGIRRADFALNHTSRVSGLPEAFFDVDDPKSADARANYQQYSDHIRSKHYRNPTRLTSCTGCHSPHANSADIAAMDTSGNDNALCTTCHSPEANPELYPLKAHVAAVTGVGSHNFFDDEDFLCTECHMVPTAKSGAAIKQLSSPIQYYWNDVASHRMVMTLWTDVLVTPDRPLAFTNQCGSCHADRLSP